MANLPHNSDNCSESTNPFPGTPYHMASVYEGDNAGSFPDYPRLPDGTVDITKSKNLCPDYWPKPPNKFKWFAPFPSPNEGETREEYRRRTKDLFDLIRGSICKLFEDIWGMSCTDATVRYIVDSIMMDPYLWIRYLRILSILRDGRMFYPEIEGMPGLYMPDQKRLWDILYILYQMFRHMKDHLEHGRNIRKLWEEKMRDAKRRLEEEDIPFKPDWPGELPMTIPDPPCDDIQPDAAPMLKPRHWKLPDIDYSQDGGCPEWMMGDGSGGRRGGPNRSISVPSTPSSGGSIARSSSTPSSSSSSSSTSPPASGYSPPSSSPPPSSPPSSSPPSSGGGGGGY